MKALQLFISRLGKGDAVDCRSISIRERILRLLFGDVKKLTLVIPNGSIERMDIIEANPAKGAGA